MNLTTLVAVMAGGAIGSALRYAFGTLYQQIHPSSFPYHVLLINVIGSCVMGAVIEVMALRWPPSPELRAFLTVGILGGFTTFSAFSLDAVILATSGQMRNAVLYIILSVLLSIGALYGAMQLARRLFNH